tara:strand:+ start:40 stop:348 length:309 start_codon:yes stop_codon:yes gene_type:complete
MKTIKFEEFAQMPEGTIFSYFKPMMCAGLYRKGTTIFEDHHPIDYFEQSLVAECENGEPPSIRWFSRWGVFDYNQKYAIYEPIDIAALVSLLRNNHQQPTKQ